MSSASFDHGLITKLTSLAVAGITIGMAVWGFIGAFSVMSILVGINIIIVSIVLLPAEFDVKFIIDGFALIDNLFGKGLYVFFIGSWSISLCGYYDSNGGSEGLYIYSLIVAIVDMCVGVLYIIFHFAFGNKAKQ